MWGPPHVTEIYLGGNKPWINPCTWNVWVKIGHIILHRGINKECLETTIHFHPRTQTQRHTHVYTRVCPSRHCWNLRYQNSWWLVTWTWFMKIQFSSRQIWANSRDDKPPFLASKMGGTYQWRGTFQISTHQVLFWVPLQQTAEFHHFCDSE